MTEVQTNVLGPLEKQIEEIERQNNSERQEFLSKIKKLEDEICCKNEDIETLNKKLDHFGQEMVPGLLNLVKELTERVQQLEADSESDEEDDDL